MYKELRLREAGREGDGEGVGAQRRAEKSRVSEEREREQIPVFCSALGMIQCFLVSLWTSVYPCNNSNLSFELLGVGF